VKLKHIFYLQAAALLLAGSLWMFAPAMFYKTGGMNITDSGLLLFGRNTGALLYGFCLIALFAARADDSALRRQLRMSFFLLHLLSLLMYVVVWFVSQVTFGGGQAIWLHVIFVLGFGYFQLFKPNE
jgi:cell division protein FtsW (lipid II flippase)